ncbi:MAG: hypothetical protein RIC35_17410 [Marinoscillum sp.]
MQKIKAIFIILAACLASWHAFSQKSHRVTFLSVKGPLSVLDTLRGTVKHQTQEDTVILEYEGEGVISPSHFQFALSGNFEDFTYLRKKILFYGTRQFEVHKLIYDVSNIADEELVLFYNSHFGLIMIKSGVSNEYKRLMSFEIGENDDLLFYLNERIIASGEFWTNWK